MPIFFTQKKKRTNAYLAGKSTRQICLIINISNTILKKRLYITYKLGYTWSAGFWLPGSHALRMNSKIEKRNLKSVKQIWLFFYRNTRVLCMAVNFHGKVNIFAHWKKRRNLVLEKALSFSFCTHDTILIFFHENSREYNRYRYVRRACVNCFGFFFGMFFELRAHAPRHHFEFPLYGYIQ